MQVEGFILIVTEIIFPLLIGQWWDKREEMEHGNQCAIPISLEKSEVRILLCVCVCVCVRERDRDRDRDRKQVSSIGSFRRKYLRE
jgi:hypothetical protein